MTWMNQTILLLQNETIDSNIDRPSTHVNVKKYYIY